MKALIIDNHALVRDALELTIRELEEDMPVLSASNATQAERLALKHTDINLILIDLALPEKSGFSTMRRLSHILPNAKTIIISASENNTDIEKALEQKAKGFIPQSYNKNLVIGAIQVVLAGGIFVPPSYLNSLKHTKPDTSAPYLTKRQLEVLTLLAKGKPNKAIAVELGISANTVGIHITAIYKALNVNNRTEATLKAAKLKLI